MEDAGRTSPSDSATDRDGASSKRRFEPLSVRLAICSGLLVAGPLAAGLYALTQHHFDRTIEAERRSAELQNRILEVGLRHQMMDRDPSLLMQMLNEVASRPDVRGAMILDHDGEIRVASQPELVGETISFESPTCLVCHSKEPEARDSWVLLDDDSGPVLRSVLPIENRPECHLCHAPAERLNGILMLDVSMAAVHSDLRRSQAGIAMGVALVALLVFAGVGWIVHRLILNRLTGLRSTARSIAAGNLTERVTVRGDDVISSLGLDFNHMAGSVAHLVAELRGQEAQLASVMNSLSDGLVVLDREGRVVASNRAFCRRLGTHPEALRGRSCSEAVGGALPCCGSGLDCPAQRCLATSEVQRRVYQTTSDGGAVDLVEEVYACPVFDDDGEVVQTVEVWRDITERVKEEERLAEIEHLVSLGTLASGFSHEMNTPLASMLVCSEAVLSRIDAPDAADTSDALLREIRDHASTIREQILRCRTVTAQFRRFSRGIPPTMEPLDLTRTVSGAVALVQPTARDAGVDLRVEEEGPVPAVYANEEVVQHVLLNLLVNAVQSCDGRPGSVAVSFVGGPDVSVQIRDTGCGIPPENRARIFEPFRSHKTNGTGLGLFLSRSFMRRLGGDVCLVDSAVGVGSCLQVVFPPMPDEGS